MATSLAILAAALVLAFIAGAMTAAAALWLGMTLAVRIRQGHTPDPLPGFKSFIEKHVATRERQAATGVANAPHDRTTSPTTPASFPGSPGGAGGDAARGAEPGDVVAPRPAFKQPRTL